MIIKDRKKFFIGFIGLIAFLIILSLWLFPVINQRRGLEWADGLFNQLTKNSAYYVPVAMKHAEKLSGVTVDLSVNPRWPGAEEKVVRILTINRTEAIIVGDGRVRIKGDLGLLSTAAITDADLLFQGLEKELQSKYSMNGKEVIYYWWTAFDDLVRRYVQLNRASEADFAKFIMTKVLEPSYNFVGIKPRNISENAGAVIFLLAFYIFYTVWYGFSIMYLFEGIGITATKAVGKRES